LDVFGRYHNLNELLAFMSSIDREDELKKFLGLHAGLLGSTLLLFSRTDSVPGSRIADVSASFMKFSFVTPTGDDRDEFDLRMAAAIALSRIT